MSIEKRIVILAILLCVGLLSSFDTAASTDSPITVCPQFPSAIPFPIPPNWKGLVPLKSTRSDVEKLFGSSRRSVPGPVIYENDSERVDVVYARNRCELWSGDWNVPVDTVIQLEVTPVKTILLEDLSFDKSKYLVRRWSHPSDWKTYTNEVEGISVETTDLGKNIEIVRVIRYFPKLSDKSMKCGNSPD